MIYTNDEGDKADRRKNFYKTVYLYPLLTIAIISGLVYWASARKYLSTTDMAYGYIFALTPAMIVYGYNRRNWLKMPDGTYHHIKGTSSSGTFKYNEPAVYEAEFYYSKWEKAQTLFFGILGVGLGIWLGMKNIKTILVPIVCVLSGIFMLYIGLKGLMDKSAKLKIAKNGLWTKQLGFVNWDDINFAEVVEDKSGDSSKTYLEIRLKGTKFEKANKPDERLFISDLKDRKTIETLINDSINNYNKQKE